MEGLLGDLFSRFYFIYLDYESTLLLRLVFTLIFSVTQWVIEIILIN